MKDKSSWDYITEKLTDFSFEKGITSFVNPYSMLILKEHSLIAKNIDYWHADGSLMVLFYNKFINKKRINRYSFDDTSLAPVVFKKVKEAKKTIAIIATEQNIIEKTIPRIENKYQIKIDLWRNGYFKSEAEIDKTIDDIIKNNIEIVICGMGTLHQESFLIKLKNKGWNGYGYTCGGYIHQTAINETYYPPFFDKYNLRWLYRMIKEPRVIPRYLFKYPYFIYLFYRYSRKLKKNSLQ